MGATNMDLADPIEKHSKHVPQKPSGYLPGHLFALAEHAYACAVGEHVIVLDTRRGEYFGVADALCSKLGRLIAGWPYPVAPRALDNDQDDVEVQALVESMFDLEIIHDARHVLAGGRKNSLIMAEVDLIDCYSSELSSPTFSDVFRFGTSIFIAKALMLGGLEHMISRFSRRRANGRSPDLDEARRLISVFRRLCPFAFTSNDACLFTSIALGEFLAARGLFPNLIFGVSLDPFLAHCWLQEGKTVLNDECSRVLQFTPIAST